MSFKDLEATKIIYGHGHSFLKGPYYQAYALPHMRNWNMFAVRDPKVHSQLRRQFQSTYSLTALVSYEPYVDDCARIFRQRLEEIAVAGSPTDLGHWLQCYAFDVIGHITYGTAIESGLKESVHLGVYPSLQGLALRLRTKEPGSAYADKFAQEKIDQFRTSDKAVSQAPEKEDDGKVETFLEKFLRKHESDPTNFTRIHVLAGCGANVGAGSDTTGISLSAIFYYLLKYPHCNQKLREEVDAVQPLPTKELTFHESQDMPYLQAVIKEALRLHPAFGVPLERTVPEGGTTIAGRFFPAGTNVSVHCWVANKNEFVFEDPDEFKPERWLTEDANKLALMNRHWIPFGLGTRTCIGRHISMLEIAKLVPYIVRDFDFTLQERADQTWETENVTFVKPRNFVVTVGVRTR
ncbi:cytochrome P450 protein [Rutstroemia sp. NJR-2017a BVV2]|nr:cytochrome P450 protein [Rutstroemia sp. NJR-2017a BVV2]